MASPPLRAARLALLLLTIVCALAVDAFGILPRAMEGARNGDFSTFYTAGRIDRNLVYDFGAISRAQEPIVGRLTSPRPYLNPPTYLPILRLLARMPINVALAIWAVVTTAAFLGACFCVARPSAVLLVVISPVVWSTAAGGQVALAVGACVIGGVLLLPRRPVLAGVLFAVAALIKPPTVALVPLALIAAREWRALFACLIAGAAGGLASLAFEGVDTWMRWFGALHEFSRFLATSTVIEKGVSPATIMRLAGVSGSAALAFQIACGLLGVVLAGGAFRRTEDPLVRLAALTAGCLLVTPYAMTQEMAPMLPFAAMALLNDRVNPLFWLAGLLVLASLAAPFGVLLMALALVVRWPEAAAATSSGKA
jgi:alpha-1,2-mannosyltransferase